MTRPKQSALAAALILAATLPAHADDLVLAGASRGANSDYAFLGAIVPLPGQTLGDGFAARFWSDYLDYSYQSGVGQVSAVAWGGALSAVYQFSGQWGWANLSAGITLRDTHLSVFDPTNESRGTHAYFAMQADGAYNLDEAWRLRGLASMTPQDHGYFTQAGIDRAVNDWLRLGVSGVFQGDRNYNEISGGAIAFVSVTRQIEIDPSVGVSHSNGQTGVYGGVTLVATIN